MLARTILFSILAALAVATPTKNKKSTGLNALAQKRGRYFGTAVNSFNLNGSQPGGPYVEILERDFAGALTAENEGKWEAIHPSPDVYSFDGMDAIVAEAKRIGAIVRGHTFVWHSQTPAYVTSITDPEELKAVFRSHVENVAGRYKDDLAYIDAINEPLNEDGTYRNSVWYNLLGPDYLEYALRTIHEVAPNSKLCINDYNIEGISPKSQAYARIAKDLLAKGAPLHCVGFQAHFVGGNTAQDIPASMKQFTDLGLEVPLTELDIRVNVDANDIANSTGLTAQATDYSTAVDACVNNKLCPGIQVWQFYDPISWIPDVFPGEGAALPYDASYNTKPAYDAIANSLSAASGKTQYKPKKH